MKIQRVIGENGVQQLCNNGACPAAIIADNGDVFIQGYLPDADEGAELKGPAGEGFVRMPRVVFEKIARHVLAA